MATTAKNEAQGTLAAVTAHENVVQLADARPKCDAHPVAPGLVPRCNCFDYDDGDEYRPPQSTAQQLLAFVADLIAHGAKLTIGGEKSPSVAKTSTRRRAG